MSSGGDNARQPRLLSQEPIPHLVSRAQHGSLPCFAELVKRFEGRLFNFLVRRTVTTHDAEDLVQDAFVRAWQRIDQYDPRWQFSTWLFTIANRLAITHGAAGNARSTGPTAEMFPPSSMTIRAGPWPTASCAACSGRPPNGS